MTTIRVGIGHPSASATELLRSAIESLPDHSVEWTARDAADTIHRASAADVSIVLVSADFTDTPTGATVKAILGRVGVAVLVVRTGRVERADEVYDAMEAGALDVVDMPWIDDASVLRGISPLVRKLSFAARLGLRRTPARDSTSDVVRPAGSGHAPALVVIGASTGGPDAINRVLTSLHRPFPAALVLVQHVDESFAPTIATWFGQSSGFPVSIARAGDRPRVGEALLAGTRDHLRLNNDGRLEYNAEPSAYPYRPSVDVFFESVAAHHRGTAIGVLLTGMGRDGAKGLSAMRRKGHRTIVQDERSSVVYGMPKAAIESDAADEILDVDRIADAIERALHSP